MSQELVNDSKNESDSCHPYSSEAAVEVFFDDVNSMLFWVLSVYYCIEMSPKNSLSKNLLILSTSRVWHCSYTAGKAPVKNYYDL